MDIDFVIPWVDGSDPEWRKQRACYCRTPGDLDECRFRDWDLLRYWFRAAEAYAPWVHQIYLVTAGQIPSWLDLTHPKLRLIDHSQYIPFEYLPTFSSHTIELNFHRIPELSEHFVYFNDDMFLNAPVKPEHFFRKGLPRDCAIMGQFSPIGILDDYTYAQCNVMGIINSHFNKRSVLRSNPFKWYDFRYGKGFLKNLYGSVTKHFSNFGNLHIPSSMLKSTYQKVWELEPDLLHSTCMHKFRHTGDVNQYIMSYFNLCQGFFSPRSADFGKCYSISETNEVLFDDILHGKHKTICVNDHQNVKNFEQEKKKLHAIYQQKLPHKSSFEL